MISTFVLSADRLETDDVGVEMVYAHTRVGFVVSTSVITLAIGFVTYPLAAKSTFKSAIGDGEFTYEAV